MKKKKVAAKPRETAGGRRIVFAISDASGSTAEALARAASEQFRGQQIVVWVCPRVGTRDEIERLVRAAETEQALVVYTFAAPALRKAMQETLAASHVPALHDPFTPLVEEMGRWLGADPAGLAGHLPQPQRSVALEFAVANDDGRRPEGFRKAQIVVLGVSRTSKTSVSYQIADRGYLVANCPIVPTVPLPRTIDEADPRRVFVLMMDAEALCRAREARLQYLGRGQESYVDVENAEAELRQALLLLRSHPAWTRIDVTGQPVEETAAMILRLFHERFPAEVR